MNKMRQEEELAIKFCRKEKTRNWVVREFRIGNSFKQKVILSNDADLTTKTYPSHVAGDKLLSLV